MSQEQIQSIRQFYQNATSFINKSQSVQAIQQFLAQNVTSINFQQIPSQQDISWQTWADHCTLNSKSDILLQTLTKFGRYLCASKAKIAQNILTTDSKILQTLYQSSSYPLQIFVVQLISDYIIDVIPQSSYIDDNFIVPEHFLIQFNLLVISFYRSDDSTLYNHSQKALMKFVKTQFGQKIFESSPQILEKFFLQGTMHQDATISIRFKELAVKFSGVNEYFASKVKSYISQIIDQIMNEQDILVRMNLISLVPKLLQSKYNLPLFKQSNFLLKYLTQNLQNQMINCIDHQFMLTVGHYISQGFDDDSDHQILVKSKAFITFLSRLGVSKTVSDNKCFLQIIGMLFKGGYLQIMLKAQDWKGLIGNLYLGYVRKISSSGQMIKLLFLQSLQFLFTMFKSNDDGGIVTETAILQVFANLMRGQGQKYVNGPSVSMLIDSLQFLVRESNTTFEESQIVVLKIMKKIIGFDMGYMLLFKSQKVLEYLLTRSFKQKSVCEIKFSLIEGIITHPNSKHVDQSLIIQFKKYLEQGVYGVNNVGLKDKEEQPQYAVLGKD